MTRDEYTRWMTLAAGLFNHSPTQATVDSWWPEMMGFTLADAEDAIRIIARRLDKWPSLASVRMETRLVRMRQPRQAPERIMPTAAERDRTVRYGRLIAAAARDGKLKAVHKAMSDAQRWGGDGLEAGERAFAGEATVGAPSPRAPRIA